MGTHPETSRRLIGRRSELDITQNHIDSLLASQGSQLFFSGESGVGKSRLVAELVDRFKSASPDSQVLNGNCFEGDHRLAFAPVLDVLRSYLTFQRQDDLQNILDYDPASFITLLPELQRRFPGVAPLPGSNPEQDKVRIFHALVSFLAEVAGDNPLLLILEDLHWSDDTSLEFLTHLAKSADALPMLIVGTFRSEEERPGLRRALVDILRDQHATELRLSHLTIDEADLLLRDFFGQPHAIRPDFLRAIYDLTEGNPFFIEETVRSLIAEGDIYTARGRWTRKELAQLRIPRSVQDALARSTEHLDSETVEVLELAAVIGKRFDFTLLQRVSGYSDSDLLSALKALTDAHLLVEESADRFRFRHALIRESVYDQLLGRERRIRHGQVAEAIESLHTGHEEPWLADLVFHCHAAARWEKAFDYAVAAGEHAQSLFAPHAAIEHFTTALEALEHIGQAPPTPLLHRRGRARETLGDFDAARHDFGKALELARTNSDRQAEWQSLIDLGRSWEGLDYDRAGEWFEEAIVLARQLDNPAALAGSLNRLGTWYCNTERVDNARAAHLEALSIFEELDDEPGIAETVDYLGTVADIAGDPVEMHKRYSQAAGIFERLGDHHRLASVLASMTILNGAFVFEAVSTSHAVSYKQAAEWCGHGLQLARDSGWRAGETYALMNLAGLHGAVGDFRTALDHIQQAREIAREIDHLEWLTSTTAVLGYLYEQILALDLAIEYLSESTALAQSSGSRHQLHLTSGYFVDALVEDGQIERAAEVLNAFPADMPMQTVGQRRLWAARANWELANGAADTALDIVDSLFQTGHNATSQRSIPVVARLRGRALVRLGHEDEAEEALREAQAGSASLAHPGKLWRTHLELSRLYHSQGRSEDALREIDAAQQIVERIAPGIPDETLRENFLSTFFTMASEVDNHDSSGPQVLANLTPRERDVARLLARGLSNRQIAEELFIGERTVETHVGNILSKLDFSSRTQIAAWVLGDSDTPDSS